MQTSEAVGKHNKKTSPQPEPGFSQAFHCLDKNVFFFPTLRAMKMWITFLSKVNHNGSFNDKEMLDSRQRCWNDTESFVNCLWRHVWIMIKLLHCPIFFLSKRVSSPDFYPPAFLSFLLLPEISSVSSLLWLPLLSRSWPSLYPP